MMAAKPAGTKVSPETQLRRFIGKMAAGDQKLFRAVRAALRKRVPAANELVYDYPGNLVISYTASDRGHEGILSLAGRPGDLRLYFGQGKKLRDPKKLLKGSATQVRYIEVESAARLADADVEALIAAAIDVSPTPLPAKGQGTLVIQKGGVGRK